MERDNGCSAETQSVASDMSPRSERHWSGSGGHHSVKGGRFYLELGGLRMVYSQAIYILNFLFRDDSGAFPCHDSVVRAQEGKER